MAIIAADIGQAGDQTAIVVLEPDFLPVARWVEHAAERHGSVFDPDPLYTVTADPVFRLPDGRDTDDHPQPWNLVLRHAERLPLATPYSQIVGRLDELKRQLTGEGKEVHLALDATGVGMPVLELAERAGLSPHRLTMTAGDTETKIDWHTFRVPKRDLIASVQMALQDRILKIPKALKLADVLVRELETYRVKVNLAADDDAVAWRERDHDDLVFALAIAVWLSKRVDYPPSSHIVRSSGGRRPDWGDAWGIL